MSDSLTLFGRELSIASRDKVKSFSTSTRDWTESYASNYELIQNLRELISKKKNVLVVGAGCEPNAEAISRATSNWLRTGVNWTNFHPQIEVDILTSTHTCTLESASYGIKPPSLLIHGVYSKVPPIFKNSITIRWSDPFLSKGNEPTALGLERVIRDKAVGPAPYIPSVRNTLFLNVMVMIWLGAKKIVFTGVDPHNPEYFFSDDKDTLLEIIRCLSRCDPWLAEWDGRNERLPLHRRATANRIQEFIKNVISVRSAVGSKEYIFEFNRGFKLLKEFAVRRGTELGYIGNSSYMKTTGIAKID